MTTFTLPVTSDEQLWQRSVAGDRAAFGEIVKRYQSLICSLAYSANGDLCESEDLAQETFLAAWKQLGELREPEKLRPWLCGIVRHLAAAARRKRSRRGAFEPLDTAEEPAALETDPAHQTVTREEAALLWQGLSGLPEVYREPVILFYREQQSVREVADILSTSEEVVRQRLSRGRALLREEMTALVQSALRRTRPGAAFALGVLAALPLTVPPAAKAATVVSALGGKEASVAAKSVVKSVAAGVLMGPVIGLFAGWLGMKAVEATARSERERRYVRRQTGLMVLVSFGLCGLLVLALSRAGEWYPVTGEWLIAGILAWVGIVVWAILAINSRMRRGVESIRSDTRES